MRLLMVAAPGGGKGTQGQRLAAKYGIQHVSSGDVLRAEVRAGAPLGREVAAYQRRGDLVPDQIVFDLLTPVVSAAAAKGGYILDGFPRTLQQAITAADLGQRLDLTLDAAVYLNVPEPVLLQRLMARARADDTADVIKHRLAVFTETTSPLIDYYRDRGILVEVDGDQPPSPSPRTSRHACRNIGAAPDWSARPSTSPWSPAHAVTAHFSAEPGGVP